MLNIAQIKELLRQERVYISKCRGQNFLVDQNTQKKIIQACSLKPDDVILEIGPGLGALSQDLAEGCNKLIAVEKDRALARILQQRLSCEYANLQLVHQDVLKFDINGLNCKSLKIIGNLPYYITTPIIGCLLEKWRQNISEIFITVQDELAKRLVAVPQSKDYSSLSILVQYFTQPAILFSLPKKAFYPQPKVNSAFVYLKMLAVPSVKVNNQEQFFKIVRKAFQQRRKTIVNSLSHQLDSGMRLAIQQFLEEAGINASSRPEQLSLRDFALIENIFYKRRITLE